MARVIEVRFPWTPRDYQQAAHAALRRFNTLVWHRRAGKTLFASEWLVEGAATHDKSYRAAYVAPFLKQARLAAWEYIQKFACSLPGTKVREADLAVILPNGAEIRIFGADNPDALRGVGWDRVVMDEVAQMRPQVWGEIVRPALMDRAGEALWIGTPKGVNLFSELFYKGLSSGDPAWYSELRTVDDTRCLPAEEVEAAKRTMSPAQVAQELYCDFGAASDDNLIALELAREAQQRQPTIGEYAFAARVLGVDVARFGGDRTVLFRRQGLQAFPPKILRDADLMLVADTIAAEIREWTPDAVFIDSTGLGAGVVDRLRQLHFLVTGIEAAGRPLNPAFLNRRAECWASLSQWIKDGGALPAGEELIADLTGPRYEFNSSGKLQLESKADLKERGLRSPDLGDALSLTFSSPVQPRTRQVAPGVFIPQTIPTQRSKQTVFDRRLGAA